MASSKKPDCSEWAVVLAKIARNLAAREDVKTYADVVERMRELIPGITRAEITDAIVSYSRFQANQIKPTIQKIREIYKNPRLEQAIKDRIEARLKRIELAQDMPDGPRKKIYDEVIEELRREDAVLASRERDARKVRELDKEILTGERPPVVPRVKTDPTTPEGKLRAEKEAEVAALRRQKARTVADNKRIARLEEEIATGNFFVPEKKHTAKTEAESRIADLQRQKSEIRKDKKRVQRLETEIAKVQKQLDSGVFDAALEKKATVRNELEQKLADVKAERARRIRENKKVERQQKEIEDLERQLKTGNFSQPKSPVQMARNEAEQRIADLRQEIAQRKRENKKTERQQSEIDDLKQQLATGKFKESLGPKSTVRTEAEQEIADLRAEVASKKKENRKAEREQERISQLEEQLRTGIFPEPKPPIQTARTEAEQRIKDLEQQIASERRAGKNVDRQSAEIEALKEQIRTGVFPEPAAPKQGPKSELETELAATKQERDEAKRIAELRERVADLREQLNSGIIQQIPTREQKVKNAEIERLEDEVYYLQQEAKGRLRAQEEKSWTDFVTSPLGAISALRFGFDMSRIGIQDFVRLTGNLMRGKEGWDVNVKSIAEGLKMFQTKDPHLAKARFERMLHADPDYVDAKRAKLALTDEISPDEVFFNRIVNKALDKIGASHFGAWHVTMGNALRFNTFKMMKKALFPNGDYTREDLRNIAYQINMTTGRANWESQMSGIAEKAALAPRLYRARLQYLTGRSLWRKEMRSSPNRAKLQKEFLKDYAGHALAVAALVGLGKLFGADFEMDPRSPDFMKLKFGERRVDIGSGLGQFAILAARLGMGQTKNATTGVVSDIRGPDKPAMGRDVMDVATDFARQRSSVGAGMLADILTGENAIGEPIDFKSPLGIAQYAGQSVVPLSFKSIDEILKNDFNAPRDASLFIVSLMGLSLQVYGNEELTLGSAAKRLATGEYIPDNKDFWPLLNTLKKKGVTDEQIMSSYIAKYQDDLTKWEKKKVEAEATKEKAPDKPKDNSAKLRARLDFAREHPQSTP